MDRLLSRSAFAVVMRVALSYFGDGRIVPNNGFTLVLPNTFTPENFLRRGSDPSDRVQWQR